MINLIDFFANSDKSESFEVVYNKSTIENDGMELQVVEASACKMLLRGIEGGKVNLSGSMKLKLVAPCDRCLCDVSVPLDLEFDCDLYEPGSSFDFNDEDQPYVKGLELDTDEFISNELMMSLPMKVLCKDDCKGLCPVCGNDLNKCDCGCDSFVPDPRMAAFQDIFKEITKEV